MCLKECWTLQKILFTKALQPYWKYSMCAEKEKECLNNGSYPSLLIFTQMGLSKSFLHTWIITSDKNLCSYLWVIQKFLNTLVISSSFILSIVSPCFKTKKYSQLNIRYTFQFISKYSFLNKLQIKLSQ